MVVQTQMSFQLNEISPERDSTNVTVSNKGCSSMNHYSQMLRYAHDLAVIYEEEKRARNKTAVLEGKLECEVNEHEKTKNRLEAIRKKYETRIFRLEAQLNVCQCHQDRASDDKEPRAINNMTEENILIKEVGENIFNLSNQNLLRSGPSPANHVPRVHRADHQGCECSCSDNNEPVTETQFIDHAVMCNSKPIIEPSPSPVPVASAEAGPYSHENTRFVTGTPESDLRVLLADDNPINRRLTEKLLSKMGHRVKVVCNGEEAVAAFEQGIFDLVLMDVQMPKMDGIQATMEIRARESDQIHHIPIIAMTACTLQGHDVECLSAGMDGYISKPISSEELVRAIYQAITCRDSRHQVSESVRENSTLTKADSYATMDGTGRDNELIKELKGLFSEDFTRFGCFSNDTLERPHTDINEFRKVLGASKNGQNTSGNLLEPLE
jgi:CheY-like chemotaxis protein